MTKKQKQIAAWQRILEMLKSHRSGDFVCNLIAFDLSSDRALKPILIETVDNERRRLFGRKSKNKIGDPHWAFWDCNRVGQKNRIKMVRRFLRRLKSK